MNRIEDTERLGSHKKQIAKVNAVTQFNVETVRLCQDDNLAADMFALSKQNSDLHHDNWYCISENVTCKPAKTPNPIFKI